MDSSFSSEENEVLQSFRWAPRRNPSGGKDDVESKELVTKKKQNTIGTRQAIRFNCLDGSKEKANVKEETARKKKEKKTDRRWREVGRTRTFLERIMTAAVEREKKKEKLKKNKTSGHSSRWSSAMFVLVKPHTLGTRA